MVKVAQKVAPPTQILSFLNLHLPAAVAHLQPAQLTTDKSAIFQKFRFFFYLFFLHFYVPLSQNLPWYMHSSAKCVKGHTV